MQASALVVGIDQYDHAPALSGAVQDALEMVQWLLQTGLQPGRIRLNISASPGATVALPNGIAANGANWADIRDSINAIRAESGDRLYVLLSGHGYYLAEAGPIFLCRDWSPDDNPDRNLGIYAHADFFSSLPFVDQFFVVDACQGYDVDPIYRSNMGPGLPPVRNTTPDARNGLTLCCAASQGQLAVVDNGRGLLTRHLLTALGAAGQGNVPLTAQDALVLDWQQGTMQLDLRPLFQYMVSPAVAQGASRLNANQTPTIQPRGRATGEPYSFVADLSGVPISAVTVDAADAAGVEAIRIELRPPVRELNLPPLPFKGFVPAHAQVIATCLPHSGWDANPPFVRSPSPGLNVKFDVRPSPAPPAPATAQPPELSEFNLRVIDSQGRTQPALSDDDYAAAGVTPGSFAPAPSQPRIVRHEHGPDFSWSGVSRERGAAAVERLSERLTRRLRANRSDLEIMISPPGVTVEQSRPNLRIKLPTTRAAEIAGYLVDEPLVRIERIGSPAHSPSESVSVGQLARRSMLRVLPGVYRIVADMPWGIGVREVEVQPEGIAECEFPEVIGRLPLRSREWQSQFPGYGRRRSGSSLHWMSPDTHYGESDEPKHVAQIESPQWGKLRILIEKAGPYWRAEPFSSIPWVEWDLLIGAGRLDAVHLSEALDRIDRQRIRGIDQHVLRIALAYAAHAQRNHSFLEAFLDALPDELQPLADVRLLRAFPDTKVGKLEGVPLFRWGVELMQRSPDVRLPGILSPVSVWCVFQTAESTGVLIGD